MATKRCPECGDEFIESVRRCPDCGVLLTESLPDDVAAAEQELEDEIGVEVIERGDQVVYALH